MLELVCVCSSSLPVLVPFIVFMFGLVLVLVLVCRLLSFFVVVLVLVSRVGVARCPLVDRTRLGFVSSRWSGGLEKKQMA